MEDITMGIFLVIVLWLAFRPVRKTVTEKTEPQPVKRVKVRRNSPSRPVVWGADDPAWDRVREIPLEGTKSPHRRRW